MYTNPKNKNLLKFFILTFSFFFTLNFFYGAASCPQIFAFTEVNTYNYPCPNLIRQAQAAAPSGKTSYFFCPFTCQQHEKPYLCSPPKNGKNVKEIIEEPVSKEKIPPPSGEVVLIIDTINRKLTVYSDGEPYKQFPVAVGKNETRTPVGNWKVFRKALNWGNGFGSRWIGLTIPWGIYGIHGTNKPYSIGTYASHGCIRMFNYHVEQLYPWVEPGTPVIIVGNPFANPGHPHRVLRRGEKGADVMEVQRNLKRLGYYNGEIDGIFGGGMEKAVIEFRKDHNLRYDNCVDLDFYKKLGL